MKRSIGLKRPLVSTIVALMLLTIGLGRYQSAVRRARAAARSQDLFFIQQAINQYTLDHHHPPGSLDDLIKEKYLLEIPSEIRTRPDGTPVLGDPVVGPNPSARHL
jgi:type II secretory pathway pseudopilin PulG